MKPDQHEVQPVLDARLAAAIGELIATWSGMQAFLAQALSQLVVGRELKADEAIAPAIALIGMEARVQIGLIKTLAQLRLKKSDSDAVSRIADKIQNIKKIRDILAHAVWEYDKKGKAFSITAKTIGRIQYQRTAQRPQDIYANARRLQTLAGEICRILQKYGYLSDYAPVNGKYL